MCQNLACHACMPWPCNLCCKYRPGAPHLTYRCGKPDSNHIFGIPFKRWKYYLSRRILQNSRLRFGGERCQPEIAVEDEAGGGRGGGRYAPSATCFTVPRPKTLVPEENAKEPLISVLASEADFSSMRTKHAFSRRENDLDEQIQDPGNPLN